MEKILDPNEYKPLGFITSFCSGCCYFGPSSESDDNRIRTCSSCIKDIEKAYMSGNLVKVASDSRGKNVLL